MGFGHVYTYNIRTGERIPLGRFQGIGTGFVIHDFPGQVVLCAHGLYNIDEWTVTAFETRATLVTPWPIYARVPLNERGSIPVLRQAGAVWANGYRHLSTAKQNVRRILCKGVASYDECGDDVGLLSVPDLSLYHGALYDSPGPHLRAAPRTFSVVPHPESQIVAYVLGNAPLDQGQVSLMSSSAQVQQAFVVFPESPNRQEYPGYILPAMSGGPAVARGVPPQGWSPPLQASVVMPGFLPFPAPCLLLLLQTTAAGFGFAFPSGSCREL